MSQIAFLTAHTLSAVGDAVLVFGLPAGLGLETSSWKAVIILWLIPAVSMLISSFLGGTISNRKATARRDNALLLMSIGLIEIFCGAVTFSSISKDNLILVTLAFVFFYAFAKEGIPKLFYNISIYRCFSDAANFNRLAGIANGLSILGTTIGTIAAALLISNQAWRWALIFDAATFIILGACIYYFGKDPEDQPSAPSFTQPSVTRQAALKTSSASQIILFSAPLIFGLNSIAWNHLPLLTEKLSINTVENGIFLIAALRLPGMLFSLFSDRIFRYIHPTKLAATAVALFSVSTILFSIFPSIWTYASLAVAQGLISGAYWSADTAIRNQLAHEELIHVSSKTLRRLALFQLAGCLVSYQFLPNALDTLTYIPITTIVFIVALFILRETDKRTLALYGFAVLSTIFYGCSPTNNRQETIAILPSLSTDMTLRPDLTYAAMVALNETSAHFFRVDKDMRLQGEVFQSFKRNNEGDQYDFELNPSYQSARNENLNADDVIFTIKHYINLAPELTGPFSQIQGVNVCQKTKDCRQLGVYANQNGGITIKLKQSDLRFPERLASPWVVLLKRDRPIIEKVGNCSIQYQTGPGLLQSCDEKGLVLRIRDKVVRLITKSNENLYHSNLKRIMQTPTNGPLGPSLTVMALYANPKSRTLTHEFRKAFFGKIDSNRGYLAKTLKLRESFTIAPRWMGVGEPVKRELRDETQTKTKDSCPPRNLKILVDNSLPSIPILKEFLIENTDCSIEFIDTNADRYFSDFEKSDIGFCWFTPDTIALSNAYAQFDCGPGGACYFNWNNKLIQDGIDHIRTAESKGDSTRVLADSVEKLITKEAYALPLVELNWWIADKNRVTAIHPAGLFQIRASDFIDEQAL
jgi:MFS family permease